MTPHERKARRAARDAWRVLLAELVDVQDAAEAVLTDPDTVESEKVRAVESELPADEPPGFVVVEFCDAFELELERLADSALESFLSDEVAVGPR